MEMKEHIIWVWHLILFNAHQNMIICGEKNGMHFLKVYYLNKMIFIEKEICDIFWIPFLIRKSFNFLSLQIIVP